MKMFHLLTVMVVTVVTQMYVFVEGPQTLLNTRILLFVTISQ